MRKWTRFVSIRNALIVLAVSVCGVITFTYATEDPLNEALNQLDKAADRALTDRGAELQKEEEANKKKAEEEKKKAAADAKKGIKPKPTPKSDIASLADIVKLTGNPDRLRAIQDPRIKTLITEIEKAKEEIEKAAEERKGLSLYADKEHKVIKIDEKLGSLVDAISRYLFVQKRLYKNLMRNAHQTPGQESQFAMDYYDHLNLRLNSVVGTAVSLNDRYGLLFNFWHVKDAKGNFEQIVFGLTPQDKDQAEEEIIRERLDEKNDEKTYAKLIQFLALRQRVTNQWAVQRLSAQRIILDPQMEACGENLVSFGYSSYGQRHAYYTALKQNDEFTTYQDRIEKMGWVGITSNRPILDVATEKGMHKEFLLLFPDFSNKESFATLAATAGKDEAAYRKEVFEDTHLSLIKLSEESWASNARAAIQSVSFAGDSFYRGDVGERIAWIAYKTRLESLASQLTALVVGITLDETAKDAETKKQEIKKRALDYVTARLAPGEKQWRKTLAQQIESTYFNDQSFQIERAQANTRFENEVFKKLWPIIPAAAQADKVLKEIPVVTKQKCQDWYDVLYKYAQYRDQRPQFKAQSQELCFKNLKDWDLAFLPAKDTLSARIAPWDPEQLKAYFEKKWAFWVEHTKHEEEKVRGGTHSKESIALAKRVKEVVLDKKVMEMMNKFFSIVSRNYNNLITSKGIDPTAVGPGTPYLAEVIPASVAEVFKELEETEEKVDPAVPPIAVDKGRMLMTVSLMLVQGKYTTEKDLEKEIRDITMFKTDLVRSSIGRNPFAGGFNLQNSFIKREGLDAIAELGEKYTPAENLKIIDKLKENKKYAKVFANEGVQLLIKFSKLDLMPIKNSVSLIKVTSLIYASKLAKEDVLLKEIRAIVAAKPALAAKLKAQKASTRQGLEAIAELGELFTPAENLQIVDALQANKKYAKVFEAESIVQYLAEARKPVPVKPLYDLRQMQRPAVIDNVAPREYYEIKRRADFEMREMERKKQEEILTPKTVHVFADKVRDALALLNITEIVLKHHPRAPQGKFLNQRATTPRELEGVLSEQNPVESDLSGQLTRSILDQKMMAQVIYDMILSQNPILAITEGNKTLAEHPVLRIGKDIGEGMAPPALEVMINRYNQGKNEAERKANARLGVQAAIDVAARNVISLRPVEEACYAKPFKRGHILSITEWSNDEKWRNVFGTSQAYRQHLQSTHKPYEKLDKTVSEFSRTAWEAINHDILSPTNRVMGHLFMIGLAIAAIAFTGGGATALIAVGGGWSTFVTGGAAALGGILQTLGMAGTAAGMGFKFFAKKFLKTFAFKLMNYLFFTELALSGYAMYFSMPAQLQYRLGIANGQIGYYAGEATTRKDIADFVTEIHQGRIAYKTTLKYTAAFFSIPAIIKLRQAYKSLGIASRNAIARESAVEGAAAIIPDGAVMPTLSELVAQHGPVRGRLQFIRQSLNTRAFFGKVVAITNKLGFPELNRLAANHFKIFFKTPEELRELYIARLEAIQVKIAKLRTAAARLRQNGGGLRSKIVAAVYRGKYYKLAVDRQAMKIIQKEASSGSKNVSLGVGEASDAEIRALVLEAYADDLDLMFKAGPETIDAIQVGSLEFVTEHLAMDRQKEWTFDSKILDDLFTTHPQNLNESTYLMRQLLLLQKAMKQGSAEAVEGAAAEISVMDRYLAGMGEYDWPRMGKLVTWMTAELEKTWVPKLSPRYSELTQNALKDSKALNQFMKDYQALAQDIKIIDAKIRAEFEAKHGAANGAANAGSEEAGNFTDKDGNQWTKDPNKKGPFGDKKMNTDKLDEYEYEDMPNQPSNGEGAGVIKRSDNADNVIEISDLEIEVTGKDGKLEWRKVDKNGKPKSGFRWFWSKAS